MIVAHINKIIYFLLPWEVEQDFGIEIVDWASGKIKNPDGKQQISLNLKADRA